MASQFFSSAGSNAVGTLMVDYLVKPIDRRIRYLFRFNQIVEDLRKKEKMLITSQTQLKEDVKEAKLQNREIEKDVEDWLTNAETVLQEAHNLEIRIQENRKCFSCCPNLCWRYWLSKEMDEKNVSITQLVDSSKFDRVGRRVSLPGIEFFTPKDLIASKSSVSALNEIMESLKDDAINMIGVWGMRGVGKTTLVHSVGNKAKESQLFDHVVMAVVSETPDIGKIQDKIADFLGLKLQKMTKEGKAAELWILLKSQKRVLIILDDICKELDLKDVGIPFGEDHRARGCKIIFTTRNKKVCDSMKCQSMIVLDVLDEQEAWSLLKLHARLENASPAIVKVAMEVARGCRGLPLAIVTLGKVLRGKSVNGWKLASHKLKSSRLMDIEYLGEEDKKMLTCILNN
ncbi:hypothetical protein V6N11_038432 [Hibiscus sabdariffa]|uniref:NB-ARC domain-containing protein n=1 Tax=Hibiscus sabdariffa TaxID=183260 RepID=A0ABR2SKL5_9ROSI